VLSSYADNIGFGGTAGLTASGRNGVFPVRTEVHSPGPPPLAFGVTKGAPIRKPRDGVDVGSYGESFCMNGRLSNAPGVVVAKTRTGCADDRGVVGARLDLVSFQEERDD